MKFRCLCGMDVATEGSLVWEGFMGSQGRNINVPAYLFRTSVNADVRGAPRQEVLSTGRYLLVDVTCRACCTLLGWQYLEAEKEDQK